MRTYRELSGFYGRYRWLVATPDRCNDASVRAGPAYDARTVRRMMCIAFVVHAHWVVSISSAFRCTCTNSATLLHDFIIAVQVSEVSYMRLSSAMSISGTRTLCAFDMVCFSMHVHVAKRWALLIEQISFMNSLLPCRFQKSHICS